MAGVLPPYGASFAVLCTSFAAFWLVFCRLLACVLPPYVNFLKRSKEQAKMEQ